MLQVSSICKASSLYNIGQCYLLLTLLIFEFLSGLFRHPVIAFTGRGWLMVIRLSGKVWLQNHCVFVSI
jgi:hypothetical protein